MDELSKGNIEIRNDDVLLVGTLTPVMKIALREKSFFEWFKESDKFFEENNIPCTLAILAEGIDIYPEWVEYIKQRKHRFKIEMHGWHHTNYASMPKDYAVKLLKEAKKKIEETFDVKVDRWYAPFSKKGFPEWWQKTESLIGVKFHTKGNPKRHFYFHYWNEKSVNKIKGICKFS